MAQTRTWPSDNDDVALFCRQVRLSREITTMDKVLFLGRNSAENLCGSWEKWAMISITEPGSEQGKVKFDQKFNGILYLQFHDSDPVTHGEGFLHLNKADAYRIVEFVYRMEPNTEGILIHCGGGVSRSAAIARWIAEEFKLPFNKRYGSYNPHVYRLLIEASQERKRSYQ